MAVLRCGSEASEKYLEAKKRVSNWKGGEGDEKAEVTRSIMGENCVSPGG